MVRIALALGVFALVALGAPPAARAAAPTDVTRPADAMLRNCVSGYKCIARAVADVNGDRQDDILFERARLGGLAFDSFDGQVSRQYDLALSPFVSVAGSTQDRKPSSTIAIFMDQQRLSDPLTSTDINGDGLADLVFTRSGTQDSDGGGAEAWVLLGRRSGWPTRIRLGNSEPGAGTMRISHPAFSEDGPERSVRLETSGVMLAMADMNQDGRQDLVFGVDGVGVTLDDFRESQVKQRADVYIMFARGAWRSDVEVTPDVTIQDLGACVNGLAGVGDVTGDGATDLVLRRCAVAGALPQLRVITGRRDWPSLLTVDDVPVVDRPDIVPTPAPTDVPPPSGGGYLPAGPDLKQGLAPLVFVQDVNGDGVADIGLEFAGKTHIWHGGQSIAARVTANRTTGVFVKAGFGALPLTRTWRPLDADGDGKGDLLLSRPMDAASLACPAGTCTRSAAADTSGRSVLLYTGSRATRRVVDAELDAPDALWNDPANVVWGLGDFNADGHDDLLLGSSPGALDSVYSLVYGPLTSHK